MPLPEILNRFEHVFEEIHELYLDRYVWQETARIVENNPTLVENSFFPVWIGTQYYRRAAIAVRALTDFDHGKLDRTDSLVTILGSVAKHARQIPRFVVDPVPDLFTFDNTVDAARVNADIDRLVAASKRAGDYVNKYIAHLDRAPRVPIPTDTEVDEAIDLVGEIATRYYLGLTAIERDLEPRFDFNWAAVFELAWNLPAQASEPPTG